MEEADSTLVELAFWGVILLFSYFLLLIWFLLGRRNERRHEADLARREADLANVLVMGDGMPADAAPTPAPTLVTAEVALASDGFKNWVFGFRNLFGGESKSFTRLFARARREAMARLKESARAQGFDAICNVRFDSADIGGNAVEAGKRKGMKMACCMVSGTAYRRGV